MSKQSRIGLPVVLLTVLSLALLPGRTFSSVYANHALQQPARQIIVATGPTDWIPGIATLWRVQVWRAEDGKPVKRADVQLTLGPPATILYEGKTDADGQLQASFQTPEVADGAYRLAIEVDSSLGQERLEQVVAIHRPVELLLTTDRPVYRTGQFIHLRVLLVPGAQAQAAADGFTRKPLAGYQVKATITNPQGIKVFQRPAATSGTGVAAWDFPISPLVGGGWYQVTATLSDTLATKTLWVEAGEAPQFVVQPTLDQPFYLPGDQVSGYVTAHYLYGRPVRDAQVDLLGWAYDGTRHPVFARTSRTDEAGFLHFNFALPEAFAADQIGPEGADFILEIVVTDPEGHIARAIRRLPVGQQVVHIRAVPEGGTLKPGVENVVYLLTAYPDATPADCQLQVKIGDETHELTTGPLGAAQLELTPTGPNVRLQITAEDQQGRTGQATVSLPVDQVEGVLLLRPDRPLYQVGETLQATVLGPGLSRPVHLVLLREGQVMSSQALALKDGAAAASIPLTPDLEGLLQLYAYKPLPDGQVISDTRTVLVQSADPLDLQVSLDRSTYRPGDQAHVTLDVRTQAGSPVSATVGLAVVDRSVFHPQEADPGLPAPVGAAQVARWFLTLDEELRTPNRDPGHPFIPDLLEPVEPGMEEARDVALNAALADWTARRPPPLVSVRSGGATPLDVGGASPTPGGAPTPLAARQPEQSAETSATNRFLIWLAILLPLGTVAALAWLWYRHRPQGRSLVAGAGLLLAVVALGVGLFLIAQGRPEPVAEVTPLPEIVVQSTATLPLPATPLLPTPTASPAPSAASVTNLRRSRDPLLDSALPQTMAWYTGTQTSDAGHLELDLQLPELITPTWQLMALAHTSDGRLGWASAPLPVYQELWAEVDLPPTLRYGEEVDVPVEVYNYYGDEQPVRVTLPAEPWFRHLDSPTQEINLPPGETNTLHFPIEVTRGRGRVRPEAEVSGRRMSDEFTPRSPTELEPDGQRVDETTSDWLPGSITVPISIPPTAIPGASQIDVQIYPGLLAQIAAGIESLLGMPYGCFEQASSVTYPNIMVLQFLQALGQADLSLVFKADSYLLLGYQLLVSFEVPGGGFSLWGSPPANQMLTAYGLMEFADMAQVRPVDEDLVQRTADWLLGQQKYDGAWDNAGRFVHPELWTDLGDRNLPVTAYVTWALVKAGYGDDPRTQKGLDYVRTHLDAADDPYVLALCANALVANDPADPAARTAVDRLAQAAVVGDNMAIWPSDAGTFVGSLGENGSLETTALAAQAMLRADAHPDLAYKALTYLMRQKAPSGAWGTTQGTVLTLQALQQAALKGGDRTDATVRVSVNGQAAAPMHFTPDNSAFAPTVSFSDTVVSTGTNLVRMEVTGTGNLAYQIHTSYYLPWPPTPPPPPPTAPLTLEVRYEPARLRVGETTRVKVNLDLREGNIAWGIIELDVPLGFEADRDEMERLLAQHRDPSPDYSGPRITRIDQEADRIVVYFEGLEAGQPWGFSYSLWARSPVKLRTPPGRAYDYYNPDIEAEAVPVEVEIVR